MDDKEKIERLERALITLACMLGQELGAHNVNKVLDIVTGSDKAKEPQ